MCLAGRRAGRWRGIAQYDSDILPCVVSRRRMGSARLVCRPRLLIWAVLRRHCPAAGPGAASDSDDGQPLVAGCGPCSEERSPQHPPRISPTQWYTGVGAEHSPRIHLAPLPSASSVRVIRPSHPSESSVRVMRASLRIHPAPVPPAWRLVPATPFAPASRPVPTADASRDSPQWYTGASAPHGDSALAPVYHGVNARRVAPCCLYKAREDPLVTKNGATFKLSQQEIRVIHLAAA
jgi:hypothetical protein